MANVKSSNENELASTRAPGESTAPVVTIVMCTYQGSRHVAAQLRSLLAQTYPVKILVVDDASTDDTVMRVQSLLRDTVDRIDANSHNLGYVRNFEQAVQTAVNTGASFIALSDQDDIWDPERVERGMQLMHQLECQHGADAPLLVHSDLRLIDSNDKLLHDSFFEHRRYRITSAKNLRLVLGENGVMGNSVLMNQSLAKLTLPYPNGVHVHDYWIALVAELYGHRALLRQPQLSYRLHADNASNTAGSMVSGWRATRSRLDKTTLLHRDFKLPFKEDSRLQVLQYLLSPANRLPALSREQTRELQDFSQYLLFKQSRMTSLSYLLRSGVTRGGLLHKARLCMATLLTKRYASMLPPET